MKHSLLAPLSPIEENALRLIGFRAGLDRSHIVRLLELDLIDWDGCSWRLTELGRRHYARLVDGKLEKRAIAEECRS